MAVSGKQELAYASLNQRLRTCMTSWKPDIFLTIKGETLSPETLHAMRITGTKTVNWFPDGLWKMDLILDQVHDYDIFFHFDSLVSDILKIKGYRNVKYLPYAADILPSDKRKEFPEVKYPVTFIGNYYPEREEYFSVVADSDFYLWGEKAWRNSFLASNYQGVIAFPRVKNILSRSGICINLHYQQSKSNGVNLRVYESTSVGTCLLTDYKKDLVKMYRLGEEVITYEGLDDFVDKLLFLKTNKKLTLKIGKSGYLRTKNEHTYVHRIKEILKSI